ncbi:MAG: Gfo/Idh/MocA family oxidoreductase [Clostridia bacterium]|nr:Gfo/Idh/MocA family oxidoreductase [Clostridia bacterium]
MNRIYTIAIIGTGARGAKAYGRLIYKAPDRYKITHLCDINPTVLNTVGDEFCVPVENRYTDPQVFFSEKRADVLVIATPDDCHVEHCLAAMKMGYDILCEKPLTDKEDECKQLLETQKKYGNKILVCHVLRYASAYVKLKELLDSGKLGKLVSINWVEPLGYWHQAHSYVRGNWRNTAHAAPMILAKCCHDLDLIQYFAGSKCDSVSSVGDLTFFKQEHAPAEATMRCADCALKETCAYSAYRIYVERWKEKGRPEVDWPYNVLVSEPITEEKLIRAIETGPYGRCVFHCDNNVVDHQSVQMLFENGVTATLQMNAFNQNSDRRVTLFGTYGMVDMVDDKITLNVFGQPAEFIDPSVQNAHEDYAHGGGDSRMIDALYGMISGERPLATSLEQSVESHLIGIKAEESRLEGGKLLLVHE